MALTLSLFHRPGSVLFLDDDAEYLDMLGMVIAAHWQVELYSRPAAFSRRMRDEPARWEADAAAQLHMIDRWRQGQPLLPQVLRYWANHPRRHQLAKTCVIDYAMPGTNGLQVLETLIDWPGARVHAAHHAAPYHHLSIDPPGLVLSWIGAVAALAAGAVSLGGAPPGPRTAIVPTMSGWSTQK